MDLDLVSLLLLVSKLNLNNFFQTMDDDIHICGSCKGQFTNLEGFISHKRQCKIHAELPKAQAGNVQVAEETAVSSQDTSVEGINLIINLIN